MTKFYLTILTVLLTISINDCYGQDKEIINKKAIVIGVANYEYANPLNNTLNDANDIANKLELLGFSVVKLLDPTLRQMNNCVDSVTLKLKTTDVFLFYFSGHGAEYNGENYLFLKNSKPIVPSDMAFETFPVNKLLGKIDYSKSKTNVLLLDACRSNPFVKNWTKSTGFSEGLANINSPAGTFIGYAASPGKTASDGLRRNGTYTEAILKFIELDGISIDQLFNKVNKEVRVQTSGKQIPFKNSSLDDDFYFKKIKKGLYPDDSEVNRIVSFAPINRPKFPLPSVMKGFYNAQLNSFASASINKTTFDKNEFIEMSLNPIDSKLWDKATPIYVEIVKRATPTSNGRYIYTEEFQTSGTNVKIKISAELDSGDYELTFGFYMTNELNQEYPPFYSKKVKITIL